MLPQQHLLVPAHVTATVRWGSRGARGGWEDEGDGGGEASGESRCLSQGWRKSGGGYWAGLLQPPKELPPSLISFCPTPWWWRVPASPSYVPALPHSRESMCKVGLPDYTTTYRLLGRVPFRRRGSGKLKNDKMIMKDD